MSEPFIGEIKMFAGTYAPLGWALCDGQLLSVSGNDALYSLLGTTYGGDGQTTFGLPDLRGRVPVHMGQGLGLSSRVIGAQGGTESVTLTVQQIPSHSHQARCISAAGAEASPQNHVWAQAAVAGTNLYSNLPPSLTMKSTSPAAVGNTGGSQAHDNLIPFQVLNYIIALTGIYPQRN